MTSFPEEQKIIRIDNYCFDERFYQKIIDGVKYYQPSVTYILGCAYPSDFGLMEWRGDVGNKRAEEILEETSEDGSFVHDAIHKILTGESISSELISTKFSPKRSLKIKRCLRSFLDWHKEHKPETIALEETVWNDAIGAAGTRDFKCKINGEVYVIDFKTSKSIRNAHKVQVCAYGLFDKSDHVALLHLGNTTKKGYSFNVLDAEDREKFTTQFHGANNLFKIMNPNAKPNSEVFPEHFKIETKTK